MAFLSCSLLVENLTPTSEVFTLFVALQVYFQPLLKKLCQVSVAGSQFFLEALLKKAMLRLYLQPTTQFLQ